MKESCDKRSELKNSARSTEADEIGRKPLFRETIPKRHEEIAEEENYGKTLFMRALMADFILHFLTGTICPSPRAYRKHSKRSRNLPATAGSTSHVRYAPRLRSIRRESSLREDVRELRKRPQTAYL